MTNLMQSVPPLQGRNTAPACCDPWAKATTMRLAMRPSAKPFLCVAYVVSVADVLKRSNGSSAQSSITTQAYEAPVASVCIEIAGVTHAPSWSMKAAGRRWRCPWRAASSIAHGCRKNVV